MPLAAVAPLLLPRLGAGDACRLAEAEKALHASLGAALATMRRRSDDVEWHAARAPWWLCRHQRALWRAY